MSWILIFTLCCLACSAVNDLVFKFFARKERSRGMFVMYVGIFSSLLLLFLPDKLGDDWRITLLWGVIGGIFSAVGNILLIESMTSLSAGMCSTIYRLNLALVVPFSVLIFGEELGLKQYLGVAFALAAILAFLPGSTGSGVKQTDRKAALLPLVMIITAAVFRAGLGLSYKYGFMQGASPNGVSLLTMVLWIISGPVYCLWRERGQRWFDIKTVRYGILSGLLVAGIIFFMAQALKFKDANASVVLPIAQMSFLVTFVLSAVFLKEKITVWKIGALLCGVAALILLT